MQSCGDRLSKIYQMGDELQKMVPFYSFSLFSSFAMILMAHDLYIDLCEICNEANHDGTGKFQYIKPNLSVNASNLFSLRTCALAHMCTQYDIRLSIDSRISSVNILGLWNAVTVAGGRTGSLATTNWHNRSDNFIIIQ